jgi:hypothetical protein
MKTIKEIKPNSTIQELRAIRDKIGLEIQDLNYEQLMKYVAKKSKLHPKRVWQKQG